MISRYGWSSTVAVGRVAVLLAILGSDCIGDGGTFSPYVNREKPIK